MAFCLDDAVSYLGAEIENALSAVHGKTEEQIRGGRELLLKKILTGKSRFREPEVT